jgi:predicted transcriptional regulator
MSKKKTENPEPSRIIRSFVIPPDLDERLAKMAEAEDRSLSWLIVRAIREMLDRAEGGKS